MAKKKGLSRPAKVFWGLLAAVLIAITGIWGYNRYMEQKKIDNLYKHGFKLLEEQTALYIKENYSGISKIEFSPIFIDGDGKFTMLTANVVPVVYDEEGNKGYLGKKMDNVIPAGYGLLDGISALEFDLWGNDVVYLSDSASGKEIDVSKYDRLPDKAKLTSAPSIDENMELLVQGGQLKNIIKSSDGSPNVKIQYNTTVKKGDYTKWR
ncbi:hypothetical protein DDV21_002440 [Streptococcus chenjunshii]|uniref:Uncharacterized protein n=1 Tax=Streptococcus chenjunshii TaxID=2173853 RepID=A0A372KJN2_9STRE|nr:hypothetical protein [Streptococcus chenjunshii]AXQ78010.1 hypothetical protein DDV21_002440 [Streptococcus chenjunshii]RFU51745.1 hypothetical protein DDV22_01325 [Streptococcus chenjunshii]RFU52216.1 hypothetical protein DDV23_10850 [Streptococcus chenjunshii]